MKTLLAVLQLTVLAQVPVQEDAEKTAAPTPPAETKQVKVIDFDDDSIQYESFTREPECFPDHHVGRRSRLVRVREDFNDKVMQSVDEM